MSIPSLHAFVCPTGLSAVIFTVLGLRFPSSVPLGL